MNLLEAIELIYETVRDEWTVCTATFKDELFDPPAGEPYIRVTVLPLAPLGASQGPAGVRTEQARGLIWCQAFAPHADTAGVPQDGVGAPLALAMEFAALFAGRDIPLTPGVDPINVQTATPVDAGSDGAWRRYDVRLPFTFQHFY